MSKLHITHLRAYNAFWLGIQFTGDKDACSSLVSNLRAYTKQSVYWHPGFLEGGCWIVRDVVLERYAGRFDGDLVARMKEAMDEREKGRAS